MLDPKHLKTRQDRLIQVLTERKLDAAVCALPIHVYYFTGYLPRWTHHASVIVFADGSCWLTTPNEPAEDATAHKIVSYEADFFSTMRQEQPELVAGQVLDELRGGKATRIGVDASPANSHLAMAFEGDAQSIDPDLWQMRRRKDPDELELIKKAIRCTEAMYRRARQIIEPGVNELHVFTELHAAAVNESGQPLTALLGNDFACGGPGGPPRHDRPAADGEIYILDLGPSHRGYFADNTRAFAVNRRPTEAQTSAWRDIVAAFDVVEKIARPGASCREIFAAVDEHFKQKRGTGMPHHLGHGIGLQPHEFPHLNPNWDDVLIEGEVFAAEPGQYAPEIAGGIRLENNYLVTADGVRNLLDFPLDLA